MRSTLLFVVLSFLSSSMPAAVFAWPTIPSQAVLVISAGNGQELPITVPDGNGGAWVVFSDTRFGYGNIYYTHLLANGVVSFSPVPVAPTTANQYGHAAISDGAGGVFIVWADYRSIAYDIYAQHVDASGNLAWGATGAPVCTETGLQVEPRLAGDGVGGFVVAWQDYRTNTEVYAQRVLSNGAIDWASVGINLSTGAGTENLRSIVSIPPLGRVFVVWEDDRGAAWAIYGQSLGTNGTLWSGSQGIQLLSDSQNMYGPVAVTDDALGFYLAVQDFSGADNYAAVSHFNYAGTRYGGPIYSSIDNRTTIDVAPDGTGGMLLLTHDTDIPFLGKLNRYSPGLVSYYPSVTVGVKPFDFGDIVPDGAGGAFVVYSEYVTGRTDVFATHIDPDGNRRWTASVCNAVLDQTHTAAYPVPGGVVAVWEDDRNLNGGPDLYANRIDRHGILGDPAPRALSARDIPGDQGGSVLVTWNASFLDEFPEQTVTNYSVWRSAPGLAPGVHRAAGSADAALARAVSMGIPPEAAEAMIAAGWESVASSPAHYQTQYSVTAPTLADSSGQTAGIIEFKTLAHTSDPWVFWESNVVTGFSVDDLAPPAPLALTASRIGGDLVSLHWNGGDGAPDLGDYVVYRGSSSGVETTPVFYLTAAVDTSVIDSSAVSSLEFYYLVTARDVHGNESDPSNEAMVDGAATGVDNRPPAISALQLLPNSPNPFTMSTEIRFGLPAAASVTIDVFDVAGRRVSTLRAGERGEGWQSVRFDGRDTTGRALPSGLYLYRVSAGPHVRTGKLVIAR